MSATADVASLRILAAAAEERLELVNAELSRAQQLVDAIPCIDVEEAMGRILERARMRAQRMAADGGRRDPR